MGVNLTSSGGSRVVINEGSSNVTISGGAVSSSLQLSSYQRAVLQGYVGTEAQFYAALGQSDDHIDFHTLPPLP